MPRNEDVMAICDYAERTIVEAIVEAKCNALQPTPGNALQGAMETCNALHGAVSGECNALHTTK
jgi:hypothetical protein